MKRRSIPTSKTLLFVTLALGSASAMARPSYQSPAPDNSANNKQQNTTADQQTNSAGDRELARKIRHAIIADKSLSTYAHNIKIIVVNGAVTLKGPVRSDDEKKQVHDLATQNAGSAATVSDELTVKP